MKMHAFFNLYKLTLCLKYAMITHNLLLRRGIMSREDMRRDFRASQRSHDSVLGKIFNGARKVAGIATGVAVAASAIKHTSDIITGKARPPLLHPWGSMFGLAGALSFYEMMTRRAMYFNDYIGLHYRPRHHMHIPPIRPPHHGRF